MHARVRACVSACIDIWLTRCPATSCILGGNWSPPPFQGLDPPKESACNATNKYIHYLTLNGPFLIFESDLSVSHVCNTGSTWWTENQLIQLRNH